MKKIFLTLLCFLFLVTSLYADVDTLEGQATSGIDKWEGQTVAGASGTDYTAEANCMGAWYMNSLGNETDQSGEGGTLIETGGTIELLPDECTAVDTPHESCTGNGTASGHVPPGYTGKSRRINAGDTETLYHADGNSTDIFGASQDLSVCFWYKPESLSWNDMISKDNGGTEEQYAIGRNNTGAYVSHVIRNNADTAFYNAKSSGDMSVNTWIHICLVFDNTDVRAYKNGSLDSNVDNPKAASSQGIASSTSQFVVGATSSGAGTNQSDGLFDELIVSNTAYTAAKVLDIYTNGIDGSKGGND